MTMKYYKKMTLLLGLLWGFIAVQRFVIAILMPTIQADMKFNYTKVGLILGSTGFIWGFAAIIWAVLGDRYGRRPVIIICAIVAAGFSCVTGMVHSVGQLLFVRGSLGFFEGGPTGPSIATVSEEAPEKSRAMHVGFVTGCFMLIGSCAGPVLAIWLLGYFGAWRPVFYVISIPALVIGIILAFVMHESPTTLEAISIRKTGQKKVHTEKSGTVGLLEVLKYKNMIVSIVISVPVMGWLWVYSGFSVMFLTKIHHIDMTKVGFIMSASGLGAFLGEVAWGAISDRIGRKKSIILTSLLCFCAGTTIVLVPVGTSALVMGVLFFIWGAGGGGIFPFYAGTLPVEAVPAKYAGTAYSVPTGVGEVLGAGVMAFIAGMVADKFGLYGPMWMASLAGLLVAIISIFYVETAPKVVARMRNPPTHEDHLLSWFRSECPTSATVE